MSPPIYTPDGSEVTEVVLPDGSTASEVVAPDGTVVFDAGPDIPDSDIFYPVDETSGSTLNDINDSDGAQDATLNGSFTWVEDTSAYNDYYVDLDSGAYATLSQSVLSYNTDFSVGIKLVTDTQLAGSDRVLYNWGDGSNAFAIGFDSGAGGEIIANAFDGSGRVSRPSINEPTAPYAVGVLITWDSTNESLELYVDSNSSTGTATLGSFGAASGHRIGEATNGGANLIAGIDATALWFDQQIAASDYFDFI